MKSAGIEKAFVVLTIIFINICLLIPVWQSATNTQLRRELMQSESFSMKTKSRRCWYRHRLPGRRLRST